MMLNAVWDTGHERFFVLEGQQVDEDIDFLDNVALYFNAFIAVYTTATKFN